MWNDSSITLDPKGENWDITSGFLSKKGFDCIRLDLGAPYFRYNPLSELDPRSVDLPDEVRRMIGVICGEGSKGDNKFFDDQAKDLLTGCLTYLIITYNY
jgi:type IV secretory pathway TraG/TraD family ATPase VirD4